MPILIFIWSLLSQPFDRPVCSMWVNHPPTKNDMAVAGCVWTPEQAALYVWREIDWHTGEIICEAPAAELPRLTCGRTPLDQYLLSVFQPGYQKQLCVLSIMHTGPPTQDEINEKCPPILELYEVRLVSTGPYVESAPPVQVCPMPELTSAQLPASFSALATSDNYELLAFQLRWYFGQAYDLVAWQNQFDAEILAAGKEIRVPPRLLKELFAQESQFWPVWSTESRAAGEVGLGQLTDDGADLVMRYSPRLFGQVCLLAIHAPRCALGYALLSPDDQQRVRDVFRSKLILHGTPQEAAGQAKGQMITWARILAVYYCAAGETVRVAGVGPSWEYALAAYHSGPECIRDGNICPAGQEYLVKLK